MNTMDKFVLGARERILVVGCMPNNFDQFFLRHPQIEFWHKDHPATERKTNIPPDVRVVILNVKFIGHNISNRIKGMISDGVLFRNDLQGTGQIKNFIRNLLGLGPTQEVVNNGNGVSQGNLPSVPEIVTESDVPQVEAGNDRHVSQEQGVPRFRTAADLYKQLVPSILQLPPASVAAPVIEAAKLIEVEEKGPEVVTPGPDSPTSVPAPVSEAATNIPQFSASDQFAQDVRTAMEMLESALKVVSQDRENLRIKLAEYEAKIKAHELTEKNLRFEIETFRLEIKDLPLLEAENRELSDHLASLQVSLEELRKLRLRKKEFDSRDAELRRLQAVEKDFNVLRQSLRQSLSTMEPILNPSQGHG